MQCLGADVKTSFCDRNHESGDPRRRNGLAFVRRNTGQTKANGRDRPLPRPLAHHEALFPLRAERFHHLSRLQRLCDQRIFCELRFAPLRYPRRCWKKSHRISRLKLQSLRSSPLHHRNFEEIGRGGPDRTRTCDLRFRKPLLYPAELRDHVIGSQALICLAAIAQMVNSTEFATEAAHFAPADRVIAVRKSASSLSAASLCIVSVTCEYKSSVVVMVA